MAGVRGKDKFVRQCRRGLPKQRRGRRCGPCVLFRDYSLIDWEQIPHRIPREGDVATHSSILAWRIPWTEEPGGHSPRGRQESDTTKYAGFSIYLLNNERQ